MPATNSVSPVVHSPDPAMEKVTVSAWGQLLFGLGSFITAITGAGLAAYAVHRTRKEPRQAAQHAADHLLYPPSEDRAALQHALDVLLQHHHELPGGHDGHEGHDELQAHREQHHGEGVL